MGGPARKSSRAEKLGVPLGKPVKAASHVTRLTKHGVVSWQTSPLASSDGPRRLKMGRVKQEVCFRGFP